MNTRFTLTIAAATIALFAAPSAGAHLVPHDKFDKLEQREKFQLGVIKHDRDVLRFYRNHRFLFSSHRRLIAAADRDFHAAQMRWTKRELKETRHSLRVRALATVNDYATAVRHVERYFGPQPFLWSCPRSEGGFGPWVPNRQGSGAGGWLQFMSGTFWSVIDDAIRHARERGMPVPSSARSWYSPLGQALAGVEMLRDGRRGEWAGSTC